MDNDPINMMPLATPERRRSRWTIMICVLAAVAVMLSIKLAVGTVAPGDFKPGTVITIAPGTTLSAATDLLKANKVIGSTTLFKVYAALLGWGMTSVKSGDYLFSGPESSMRVAYRLDHGIQGFPIAKVTIPEGSDSRDMADIIAKAIPGFDTADFLPLAKAQEGYLFPDTYFWPTNLTPKQAVDDMRAIFDQKIASIQNDLAASHRTLQDEIAMASIVEREATSSADRRIVAGILWKRLDAGMALQADASFFYVLSTSTKSLTPDDLRMKSPYNLYIHTGLPPTPIGNPGLDAIGDTLAPTKTSFWYYLAGKDGVTHYAATLDEHNANIAKYLN